jgi:hypothetical protein
MLNKNVVKKIEMNLFNKKKNLKKSNKNELKKRFKFPHNKLLTQNG